MNTKTIGEIGEAHVLAHLLEKDYTVLVPWGDNKRYDLVYESNNKFVRIQIKTISIKNGVIPIDLTSTYLVKNNKRIHKKYSEKEIDELWVYCLTNKEIYCIPIEELGNQNNIWLRVETPKQKQKTIHSASDFVM